jgi:hypothetical protein
VTEKTATGNRKKEEEPEEEWNGNSHLEQEDR